MSEEYGLIKGFIGPVGAEGIRVGDLSLEDTQW